MNQKEFNRKLAEATAHVDAADLESEYWVGVIWGLRRAWLGKAEISDYEHAHLIEEPDRDRPYLMARHRGYKDGLAFGEDES